MMQRYKLVTAYDGTDYAGWQVQPSGRTIQGELESVFFEFTREKVKIHGSGRTDQGVHAAGQVAHLDLDHRLDSHRIIRASNALLPPDIRILKVIEAPNTFHARRSATGKEYRYRIWNGPVLPPFIRRYRCHIREKLDIEAMQTAAATLTGLHDFASFTANPHRTVESTIRNLFSLTIRRTGYDIDIIAKGDGFLYKMVRSLAGFLIRVGSGGATHDEAAKILRSRLRTARVPTASPEGLFLWQVNYQKRN